MTRNPGTDAWICEKVENFKNFVRDVSKNGRVIEEYEEMEFAKLSRLASLGIWALGIEKCETLMQQKLGYVDQHKGKMKRYLQLFLEYSPPNLDIILTPEEEAEKKVLLGE